MAVELVKNSPNKDCPIYMKCKSLATPSSPLCPNDYNMCHLHLLETNPELYKKIFQQV